MAQFPETLMRVLNCAHMGNRTEIKMCRIKQVKKYLQGLVFVQQTGLSLAEVHDMLQKESKFTSK